MATDEIVRVSQHILRHPRVHRHLDSRLTDTGDETLRQHLRQAGQRGSHSTHRALPGRDKAIFPHARFTAQAQRHSTLLL